MLNNFSLNGELKTWHKVTLDFEGPEGSETPETFLDMRLDVTFTNQVTGTIITVPGFFAADGDAANSQSESGNTWRVNFNPPETGEWSWEASFLTGDNVAVAANPVGDPVEGIDGANGSFSISESDKSGDDLRAKGMIQYDGDEYLSHAGDGSIFLKSGVGSPENFLAYSGFDGTTDNSHSFDPHVQHFNSGDPTWGNGEGEGIIGAVNYLADQGVNSLYMMTMNVGGDGRDVWPWSSEDLGSIGKSDRKGSNNLTTEAQSFDVSKLAQWEMVFSHMEEKGINLHLFLQETENDHLLNDGDVGTERALFMREMVARFGHHNGVIWNLGEENTNSTSQIREQSEFLKSIDPYDHPVALHTYPNQHNRYENHEGTDTLDVLSFQTNKDTDVPNLDRYQDGHAENGRPIVAFLDEPGNASVGLAAEGDKGWEQNHENLRDVLWESYTEGASGAEWYYGYQTDGGNGGDLALEDFSSRESAYKWSAAAREFFEDLPLGEMREADGLTQGADDYVIAKDGEVYAIYLPNGEADETVRLDLGGQSGETFNVFWFDPRNGGDLIPHGTVDGGANVNISQPPNNADKDWAVLVRNVDIDGFENPPLTSGGVTVEEGVSIGEDGLVVIEAENAELTGNWAIQDIDGSKGDGLLIWDTNKDSFNNPKDSLSYKFTVDRDGDYFMSYRGWKPETGEPDDRNNDFFFKLTDSSGEVIQNHTKMFFTGGSEKFIWGTKFDINHTYPNAVFDDLEEGEVYTLELSGRSRQAGIDRIHINEGGFNRNANAPASEISGVITQPEDPADPVDPIDPVDPADPVDPVDPVEPRPAPGEGLIAETDYLKVYLVDTDSDEIVPANEDGSINFDLIDGRKVAVVAERSPDAPSNIGSVRLEMPGIGSRVENVDPYALFGDTNGDYFSGKELNLGDFGLTLTVYSNEKGRGNVLERTELDVSVVEASQPDPVEPVNQAPVAEEDNAVTDEDSEITINVLNNDNDPDGDALSVEIVDGPANGAARVNADGTITYTPDANSNGDDQLTYQLRDPEGLTSAPVSVNLSVNAVNDAPIGVEDSASIDHETATLLDVLANDTDIEGDDLAIVIDQGPAKGTVSIQNGQVLFTPNDGASGADSFIYQAQDSNGGLSDPITVTLDIAQAPVQPDPDPDPAPIDPVDPADPVDPVDPVVPTNPHLLAQTEYLDVYMAFTDTDEFIALNSDGSLPADALEGRPVAIVAHTRSDAPQNIGSVRLDMAGINSKVENVDPYTLFGDTKGDYFKGAELGEGDFDLTLTVYAKSKGRGEVLETEDLVISVTNVMDDQPPHDDMGDDDDHHGDQGDDPSDGDHDAHVDITLFAEDFNDLADGTVSSDDWQSEANNKMADNGFNVIGVSEGAYEFSRSTAARNDNDSFAKMMTNAINISEMSDISLSFSLATAGGLENKGKWMDFFKVIAHVDGMAHELLLHAGEISGGEQVFELQDIPEGDTLVMEFQGKTTAHEETIRLDNIQLSAQQTVVDDGSSDDGMGDGSHDDGSHDDGMGDGSHDDGSHDDDMGDGSHDDGSHDDGMDDGSHDDGSHDDDMGDGHDVHLPGGSGSGHGHSDGHAAHTDAGRIAEHNHLGQQIANVRDADNSVHAVKSGAWDDPTTWSTGEVPGENANVYIPNGIGVLYSTVSDVRLMGVAVDGGLHFATNTSSKMIIDELFTGSNSILTIGTEDNPVQSDVNVDIIIRSDTGSVLDAARIEEDPTQLGHGIVTHGQTRIFGEDKTEHAKVAEHPEAGDNTLVFEGDLQGWSVGDRLVVTGTTKGQKNDQGDWITQDELVTVKSVESINGQTLVTLNEALEYDHTVPEGYEDSLAASVGNLSRNVTIQSEYQGFEELGLRGHVMFMHNDDVNVQNASFEGLGRTDKSRPQDHLATTGPVPDDGNSKDFRWDEDGTVDPQDITNQPGRYGLHIHRAGTTGRDEAVLEGNVVFETPGWGIVHHDSHAAVNDNVVYGVRGAAIVAESGNETGEWIGNLTVNTSGTGGLNPRHDHRQTQLDDGFHQGIGFAFKSRLVTSEDNISVSSESTGYAFNHVSNHNLEYHNTDFIDANGYDIFFGHTEIGSRNAKRAPNETPTRHFADNETYAGEQGFFTTADKHRKVTDVTNLVENLVAWEVKNGITAQYQEDYTFKGGLLLGTAQEGLKGSALDNITSFIDLKFIDMKVENFYRGLEGGAKKSYKLVADVDISDLTREQWFYDHAQVETYVDGLEDLSLFGFTLNENASDLSLIDNKSARLVGEKTDSIETDEILGKLSGHTSGFQWHKGYMEQNGYYTKADGTPAIVLDVAIGDTATGSVGVYQYAIEFKERDIVDGAVYHGQIDPSLEDGFGELEIVDLRQIGETGNLLEDGDADVLLGTQLADVIDGSALKDYVYAGAGDDAINGGDNDDWLKGSGGDDTLSGGDGADTFVFEKGDDADLILDYNQGEGDVIELSKQFDIEEADVTSTNEGLRIDFGDGDRLILHDVDDLDQITFTQNDLLWS